MNRTRLPREAVAEVLVRAEQEELIGLQEVCLRLQRNIDLCLQRDGHLRPEIIQLLVRFHDFAQAYIATPQASKAISDLIGLLGVDLWPAPLQRDEVEGLEFILKAGCGKFQAPAQIPSDAEAANAPAVAACIDAPVGLETQTVDEELIALLTEELTGMQREFDELLSECEASDQGKEKALESCAERISRLASASETVGLSALKCFLQSLHDRILNSAERGVTRLQHEFLVLLPGAMLAYLSAPTDPSTCEGLIDLLRGDVWETPIDDGYATTLSRALSLVQVTRNSNAGESRQIEALPEDVSLALPDDLNQELLDGLLLELPVHTAAFSDAIQRVSTGKGDMADIEAAKRAAHTLKGAANTVGVRGIANLTHHVEDILVALSKHETLPNSSLSAALTNAGDCLETMGEAVMGTGPEPDHAVGVLQDILDWANRIDREGIPEQDAASTAESVDVARQAKAPEEVAPRSPGAPAQHNAAMIRVPAGLIDELLRLMGETIILTGQVRERLRRFGQKNHVIQRQNRVFVKLAAELEELIDLRHSAGRFDRERQGNEFDPLEFEHYSELHTVSRRLIEAATDAGELSGEMEAELGDLNELIEVQNRLHLESQGTVMRTRMVPVSTVASRLQRSVRQAARLLDKRVALNIIGADTMVDSNILGELVDPLMHILRNAVDHGIESPEKRIAQGKDEEGGIELTFSREGNQVVVRCRDDGAGLDLETLRQIAEERGLLATDHNQSDDELARLIFTPGFSTRTESTQISGRGIGMDVVHSRVLQLKGLVNLRNMPGEGLEIELRLPATLIATYALLVRLRGHQLAVSSHGVQDIHYITAEQLQNVGGERFLRVGDELYSMVDLGNLLDVPDDRRSEERNRGFPVLLVRLDSGAMRAVRVQEIVDSGELVVKNLGRYVPKIQGVVGATILGDGSVAAVVDVPELMRAPQRLAHDSDPGEARTAWQRDPAHHASSRFSALVVDDSLSARRATAQFMKDAGFEVRTAIDGLEAVAILDNWKPDILLVDMEMPRMNGLELTAHVRAREGMAETPVIMITSRSTEKHRRQATAVGVNVYLTKPFADEQLLGHVTELTAA